MWHDEPKAREAFRQGATLRRRCVDLGRKRDREMGLTQWLDELEEWDEGEPPAAPVNW